MARAGLRRMASSRDTSAGSARADQGIGRVHALTSTSACSVPLGVAGHGAHGWRLR